MESKYNIPIGIKTYLDLIQKTTFGVAYLSGGALQPRKSEDFDIVVLSNIYSDILLQKMLGLYKTGWFDEITCHRAYADAPDDKFHTIFVTDVRGVKVDFLFAFRHEYTIESIMDRYPLSIQMQSCDTQGDIIRGSKFREDKIVVYNENSALEKYKGYYPEKEFIYGCG